MVSRSSTATMARKRKATLKMAAREKEIIGAVWGERERGQSNGSDGVGVAHLGARDGDGGKCLSFAHLGECRGAVRSGHKRRGEREKRDLIRCA